MGHGPWALGLHVTVRQPVTLGKVSGIRTKDGKEKVFSLIYKGYIQNGIKKGRREREGGKEEKEKKNTICEVSLYWK